ncbi:MAG TPA: hypothetical protein VFC19_11865 [Candidatus Limnocylindrales bacterium]|nr:hypothetical protein [Candidatus Limnocylindrales bacterium]
MWCLDPVNSAELIAALRPHAQGGGFEVAWVGEGWRSLVEDCHHRLSALFPDYELVAIKQSWGVLVVHAFARQRVEGEVRWSSEKAAEMDVIVRAVASMDGGLQKSLSGCSMCCWPS